jgi:predicted Rossmann fold nucleotide-binding protein DprA/Smf involved in DNA uptake
MENKFALAIVGARELDKKDNEKAKTIIRLSIEQLRPSLVISGGAIGIDTLAESIALELEIPTKIYLPSVKKWAGYKERNDLIAKNCTHLLRIVPIDYSSGGSLYTFRIAKELGKKVKNIEI